MLNTFQCTMVQKSDNSGRRRWKRFTAVQKSDNSDNWRWERSATMQTLENSGRWCWKRCATAQKSHDSDEQHWNVAQWCRRYTVDDVPAKTNSSLLAHKVHNVVITVVKLEKIKSPLQIHLTGSSIHYCAIQSSIHAANQHMVLSTVFQIHLVQCHVLPHKTSVINRYRC